MPPMDSVDTMLTSILRLSRVQTGKPSHERPVSDRNPMFQSWTPGPNIGGPDSSHRPGPFVQRVTPPSDVAKRNETKRDRLVGSGDRLVGTEKRRRPRRNRTRWFGRATRWGEDGARSELGGWPRTLRRKRSRSSNNEPWKKHQDRIESFSLKTVESSRTFSHLNTNWK